MKRRTMLKAVTLTTLSTPILFTAQGFTGIKELLDSSINSFKSNWENWPEIKWIGPEFWANRLQDWQLINGEAECVISAPNRTVHILTHQLSYSSDSFSQAVKINWLNEESKGNIKSYAGFRLGAKGRFDNYQSAAVFGEGFDIGVNGLGQLMIGEKVGSEQLTLSSLITLRILAKVKDGSYEVEVVGSNGDSDKELRLTETAIPIESLTGNLSLVSHFVAKETSEKSSVAFSDWKFEGDKIKEKASQVFGPIFFAQYTLQGQTLKLTAQLAPLEQIADLKVEFQIKKGGSWKTLQSSPLDSLGRFAHFKIEDWNYQKAIPYRVLCEIPLKTGMQKFTFDGVIAAEPSVFSPLKAAVFSCNADHGFPDKEVAINVAKHQPDIAFFLGDQFYESTGGFGIDRRSIEKSSLDYLRKWYMFGWSYRDIFRTIPAAIIPDDHDVYHGNVWGEGGAHASTEEGFGAIAQDQGGYKMPAKWVNMIQRTQTSHLPDPYDPTPVKQDIGVYYTDWKYGGVSFAILEDRKFKSAPKNVLPKDAQVRNGFIQNPEFDIKKYYDISADLLGERQMTFLNNWVEKWSEDVMMKTVLSQTNFCTVATLPAGSIGDDIVPSLATPEKGEYVNGDIPTADMDSNGWPQKGRDQAVKIIRKAFALHVAGDQHLASTVQYGVEEYGDSGFAFAGPALNNLWPRRWWPQVAQNHKPIAGKAKNTGDFEDGFGNKMTIHAVANPYRTGYEPSRIYDRGTGYGIITFKKEAQEIEIECWPRNVDPERNPEGQYEGWPIQINQSSNYGRKALGYLSKLRFENVKYPLVSIRNENTNELEYNLRVNSDYFEPKVFSEDIFTITVTDLSTRKTKSYKGLSLAHKTNDILVDFLT